jgi:hypothetical protein
MRKKQRWVKTQALSYLSVPELDMSYTFST